MRMSQMFGKRLREIPAEADTESHRLLLRAGMITQLVAGVYSYLPIALRSLRKIENIVRDEMNRAGGQEVQMPSLQPVEPTLFGIIEFGQQGEGENLSVVGMTAHLQIKTAQRSSFHQRAMLQQ